VLTDLQTHLDWNIDWSNYSFVFTVDREDLHYTPHYGLVPSNLLPETLGVEAEWIILAACTVIQQLWQLRSDTTALDAAARVFIFEDTRRSNGDYFSG